MCAKLNLCVCAYVYYKIIIYIIFIYIYRCVYCVYLHLILVWLCMVH